ncbi:tyrosine-protein kinase transforming protein Abl, partial [Aphelenchoides avenae]
LDEYQVNLKVGDLGLCRRSDEFYEYHTIKSRILPFPWCAPECIADFGRYSDKSDVWAFGVTLWEFFSRSSEPYGKGATCEGVLRQLHEGNRLQMPAGCPPEVYNLMLECWQRDPETRPGFAEIVLEVNAIVQGLEQRPEELATKYYKLV